MIIRQSTEITVLIGPFVDKTDGVTLETGLAGTGTQIDKNGAGFAAGPNLGTMDATVDGWYPITLTTTHTNTLGRLLVQCDDAAVHLPVWREFNVVEEQVWDSLMSSDKLQVHTAEISSGLIDNTILAPGAVDSTVLEDGAITAAKLGADCITAAKIATDAIDADALAADAVTEINAGAAPTIMQTTTIATLASQTSFTLTAGSADDDAYNGAFGIVVDSVTSTQKCICDISDYTGATKTVTLASDPGIFTMAVGDTIHIVAAAPGTTPPTAAAVADAVLDEALSGHTGAGSLGKAIADIEADTNELQTDDYPTSIAAVKSDTATILLDTGTDGVVVAAGSKTGYSLAADQSAVTVGTVTTLTGHTAQTGDSFARLGEPAGSSVSADVAAVKTDTGNLVTRITAALFSGITSLAEWLGLLAGKQAGDATALTEIKATGAGSGTYDPTTDALEALRDNTGTAGAGLTEAGGDGDHLTEAGGTGDQLTAVPEVDANVTKWLGTAAATPTTAGVPEVDVTYWQGSATTKSTGNLPDVNVAEISDDATAADNLESYCDGTDNQPVDAVEINSSTTAAANIGASALGIVTGACEGTPSTTVIQTDLAETTDDHYIGRVIVFTSGAAAYQATDITDYTGATGTVTVTALTTAPSASDTFVIV